MDADWGESDIIPPLKAIFELPIIDGYRRRIFVLTDGVNMKGVESLPI